MFWALHQSHPVVVVPFLWCLGLCHWMIGGYPGISHCLNAVACFVFLCWKLVKYWRPAETREVNFLAAVISLCMWCISYQSSLRYVEKLACQSARLVQKLISSNFECVAEEQRRSGLGIGSEKMSTKQRCLFSQPVSMGQGFMSVRFVPPHCVQLCFHLNVLAVGYSG